MAQFNGITSAITAAAGALAFVAAMGLAQGAEAGTASCVATSDIAPLLSQHFGEETSFVGVLPNENVIEVFHNDATESWTVAVSVPASQVSCVVATGSGQYALNAQLKTLKAL